MDFFATGVRSLEIRTDSQFVLQTMNNWEQKSQNFAKQGWKDVERDLIVYRAELEELLKFSGEVNIRFVSSVFLRSHLEACFQTGLHSFYLRQS